MRVGNNYKYSMDLIFKIEKDKTKEQVIVEVTSQLELIKDIELAKKINSYLIEPTLHLIIWDYSEKGTKFPGWLIIKSEINDTGILYSEYGFSTGNWGLIKLSDKKFHFGPDYHWYSTLEEVFLDSWMGE